MTADEIRRASDGLDPNNELSNPAMSITGALLEIAAQLAEMNSYLRFFVDEQQSRAEREAQ